MVCAYGFVSTLAVALLVHQSEYELWNLVGVCWSPTMGEIVLTLFMVIKEAEGNINKAKMRKKNRVKDSKKAMKG